MWTLIVLTPLLPDIRVHWNYTHSLWPHYVALFRGHLNFSTVSLLGQTTFRYSMSNKSPEQLSLLFVQKLTNVTRPFYISPDSAELANSLCLCIISYSLSPHNQILFYAFICSFHCSIAVDLWGIRWTGAWTDVVSLWLLLFFFFSIKPDLQRLTVQRHFTFFFLSPEMKHKAALFPALFTGSMQH